MHFRYSHIINGYIGSKSFLIKLGEVVKKLKEVEFFSCQNYEYLSEGKPKPYIRVWPSDGRHRPWPLRSKVSLYPFKPLQNRKKTSNVSFLRELLPVYQDTILPLADVAIPNQFEAELLTGAALEANIKLCSNQAKPSQMKRKPWQWWKSCTKREYPRLSSQGGSRREILQIFRCLSQHWARKQWPLGGSGQLQQDQH